MTKTYLIDTAFLDDNSAFQRFYSKTSPYRQKKTDSFRFRKDKNLCLGAGVLLDYALKEFSLSEKEMTYSVGEFGKPHFVNHSHIHFNLSHSHKCVIASVSDKAVGCDIELVTEQNLDIAERFFHKNEYMYLKSLNSPKEQTSAFFRLWTLKESYVKALGTGMTKPFDEFAVEFGEKITLTDSQCENPHFFREYPFGEYMIACCSEQDSFQDELRIITLKDLK
ncbi:MAG: 4'-phosphopantetheinyl transferase family protein [Ruminococcus sp.]